MYIAEMSQVNSSDCTFRHFFWLFIILFSHSCLFGRETKVEIKEGNRLGFFFLKKKNMANGKEKT